MRQQAECLGVTLSVGLATNVCQKAFMVNVNNLAAVLSRKPASTNHAVKMTRVKWCYGFLILFTWKWLFFCVCRIFHATANGVHYGSYVFKRGENALILHIKALHTLKLELSYNLDDFHLFISRPSCYMCEVDSCLTLQNQIFFFPGMHPLSCTLKLPQSHTAISVKDSGVQKCSLKQEFLSAFSPEQRDPTSHEAPTDTKNRLWRVKSVELLSILHEN